MKSIFGIPKRLFIMDVSGYMVYFLAFMLLVGIPSYFEMGQLGKLHISAMEARNYMHMRYHGGLTSGAMMSEMDIHHSRLGITGRVVLGDLEVLYRNSSIHDENSPSAKTIRSSIRQINHVLLGHPGDTLLAQGEFESRSERLLSERLNSLTDGLLSKTTWWLVSGALVFSIIVVIQGWLFGGKQRAS